MLSDKKLKETILSIQEAGWTIKSICNKDSAIIYSNDVFDGSLCRVSLKSWSLGHRVTSHNILNKLDYFSHLLAKENWVLVGGEYKTNTSTVLISNKDFFNGRPCKTSVSRWKRGTRPNIASLTDPTGYLSEEFKKEGWELISEYEGLLKPLYIRNLNFCSGFLCKTNWARWTAGFRPDIGSLVDTSSYVETILIKEGWELLSKYTGASDPLYIRNENFFGGHTCRVSWARWNGGTRPNFLSVVEKEKYIQEYLFSIGYSIESSDFKYENNSTIFKIKCAKTDKVYSVRWRDVVSSNIPKNPKKLILVSIHNHLKQNKDFSVSRHFDESYWLSLKSKFPFIPHGSNIDHIIPISWWGTSWSQMRYANDPTNLRLLSESENRSRSNRLTYSDLNDHNLWTLFRNAENPKGYTLLESKLLS
jgi:hypothetical protein